MTLTIITSKYILFTLERIIFAMLGLLKANHELDLSPSKIDDLKKVSRVQSWVRMRLG